MHTVFEKHSTSIMFFFFFLVGNISFTKIVEEIHSRYVRWKRTEMRVIVEKIAFCLEKNPRSFFLLAIKSIKKSTR